MFRFVLPCAFAAAFAVPAVRAQTTVAFEQQPLPPQSYQEYSAFSTSSSFTTQSVTFGTAGYGSWGVSNVYNPTTPGFTNQYAAYNAGTAASPSGPGTNGAGGSANYAVANNYDRGDTTVAWNAGQRISSLAIANTTYAYLSMTQGDSFVGGPFGGPGGTQQDFFLVTVYGKNGTAVLSQKEVYLADFHYHDPNAAYVVDRWTTVDLSGFDPAVTSLEFDISSSRNNMYGNLAPAYFAVDNLLLTPVPEPVSVLAVATGVGLLAGLRRRQRSGSSASVAGSAAMRMRSLPVPVAAIITGTHPLTAHPSASGGTSS